MPSVTSSFGDGVTECRIKRLFNADLVGPRTLIVPIFLQPLLHSFSLSVKCTRKKSDLFRIWRSPLEIGFTTALSSYSQLFNTLRKNDSLAQNISDKGILLFVSFGNSSRSTGKTALIGNRLWTSLEAKILRPFRDWVGLARKLQEDQVPKCNDQHCQWLHPPFLYCFSCYWWSIQEDTIGKVWSRRKQKGTVVEIGQSNVKVFFCCRWIYVSRFWILQPAMPIQKD